MEYINKQQAIDLMESLIAERGHAFNPHKLAMALKDMESVEIVHCKDCEFWTPESELHGNGPNFCCHDKGMIVASADDYCSYAKVRVNK